MSLGHTDPFLGGHVDASSAIEDLTRRVRALEGRLRLFRGNPEGEVLAGPGTLCQDPENGNVYAKKYGTGATGWWLLT